MRTALSTPRARRALHQRTIRDPLGVEVDRRRRLVGVNADEVGRVVLVVEHLCPRELGRRARRASGRPRSPRGRSPHAAPAEAPPHGSRRDRCRLPGCPTMCGRRSDGGTEPRARGRRRRARAREPPPAPIGTSHSRNAWNHCNRSAYGTAAFAGDVDGSTNRPVRPIDAFLRSELGPLVPEPAVRLLADERDGARRNRFDARLELVLVEVAAPQVTRAGRRPVGGIGQPVAELRQRVLLLRVVEARREAGVVEQPPEVVPRVREVRRRGRRHASRIDPAEDACELWDEDVGDGARSSCHAADSVARAASTSPCKPTSSAAAPPGAGAWSTAAGGATSRSGRRASCGLHPTLVEALLEQHAQLLAADRRVPDRLRDQAHLAELLALLRRRSTARSTPPRTTT